MNMVENCEHTILPRTLDPDFPVASRFCTVSHSKLNNELRLRGIDSVLGKKDCVWKEQNSLSPLFLCLLLPFFGTVCGCGLQLIIIDYSKDESKPPPPSR